MADNKFGFFVNYMLNTSLRDMAINHGARNWTIMSSYPYLVDLCQHVKTVSPEAKIVVRDWRPQAFTQISAYDHATDHYNNHYQHYRNYTTKVMPLNEVQIETPGYDPNSASSMQQLWSALNGWMLAWIARFRQLAPEATIVFPSPAPGVFWDDDRGTGVKGIDICWDSIHQCNLIGQNNYWYSDGYGLYSDGIWYAYRYQRTVQQTGMPVWITEYNSDIHASNWHNQIGDYLANLEQDNNVIGATCFLLQAHDGQFPIDDVSLVPNLADKMGYIYSRIEPYITPPIPPNPEEAIRQEGYDLHGLDYNPTAGLLDYARDHNMGGPLTPEYDLSYGGVTYRCQGFKTGIAYCALGDWGNIYTIIW